MTRAEVVSQINEIKNATLSYKASVFALRDTFFGFISSFWNGINIDIGQNMLSNLKEDYSNEIYKSATDSSSIMQEALTNLSNDAEKAIRNLVDAYNSSLASEKAKDKNNNETPLEYVTFNILE